ncbi:gas vesicle protein [Flexivirga endophytica]|uniref:Gas vesicle protein n=1 Tax=Flexivirga endophytica TaxID=1849103 RepID=A0A916WW65_9MICO|nr:GvpL/GvpF family gas vesicle protein [Flexivirga endophytica]GGB35326.1 gas vesicle protein [Flexivirga endophytica]GHB43115.1 gas vesicle protein [Flexivirga endophytica]
MSESGRYLYAVTRGLEPQQLAGTPGLDGGHLDVVEHLDLCAVVSDVALDEYGEEGLRRNLEHLDWLERVARTHDSVVHAVASVGPTAPLRLATVYLDDEGVRRGLAERCAELDRVLGQVAGRLEWSVKVLAPATPVVSTAERGMSGAEYLRRKKASAEDKEINDALLMDLADKVYEALADGTVASRRLQPQDQRLTGLAGTMLLNAAYLVQDDDGPAFQSHVKSLQAEHHEVSIECQGPWPPYSFAVLEQ